MAVAGTWNVTLVTPMGDRPATLVLDVNGSDLSGTFGGPDASAPFSGGTADGDKVKFKANMNGPMGPMELAFDGAADGDKIGGSVQFGAFGAGTWRGTRA